MKKPSDAHEKGGCQTGKVKVPAKTEKVVPPKRGNKPDLFKSKK